MDFSEHRSHQETARARDRLNDALEGSLIAVVDRDIAADTVFLSPTWAAMLGAAPGETRMTLARRGRAQARVPAEEQRGPRGRRRSADGGARRARAEEGGNSRCGGKYAARCRPPHVPVILFTVHNERADVIRGLKAGADGYIAKPISPSELVNAVKTVLGI